MDEKSLTITVEQAAKLAGISRGLAYQMANQKIIPVLRLGKRLLVLEQPFLDMLGAGSPTAEKDNIHRPDAESSRGLQ